MFSHIFYQIKRLYTVKKVEKEGNVDSFIGTWKFLRMHSKTTAQKWWNYSIYFLPWKTGLWTCMKNPVNFLSIWWEKNAFLHLPAVQFHYCSFSNCKYWHFRFVIHRLHSMKFNERIKSKKSQELHSPNEKRR